MAEFTQDKALDQMTKAETAMRKAIFHIEKVSGMQTLMAKQAALRTELMAAMQPAALPALTSLSNRTQHRKRYREVPEDAPVPPAGLSTQAKCCWVQQHYENGDFGSYDKACAAVKVARSTFFVWKKAAKELPLAKAVVAADSLLSMGGV